MSGDAKFPDHPFWDYSLMLYARAGVSDACLSLQDEYGLNVNLLLFCVWSAAGGVGELGATQIRTGLGRTRDWQERVVQPLREVRRYTAREGIEPQREWRRIVKSAVQQVELAADHVEQLILADMVAGQEFSERTGEEAARLAVRNLALYLGALQVDVSDGVSGYLERIVSAAFPDAGADTVRRLLRGQV